MGVIYIAIGADIETLGVERRQRTPGDRAQRRKWVTIPLAPRTALAIDHAIEVRS